MLADLPLIEDELDLLAGLVPLQAQLEFVAAGAQAIPFPDARKIAEVRAAFEPHLRADGAHFVRPMHVRLLRRP
jgi:hypothetical protein